ncbi:MAG: ribonuclease domain-containing protein [Lachnospiraceae bacterium]|nr:ribonuclease [Robinsoniella sp.]MDY3766503.1 ribonuclease domain-containing protein [Lachnospiraceae bacterium]
MKRVKIILSWLLVMLCLLTGCSTVLSRTDLSDSGKTAVTSQKTGNGKQKVDLVEDQEISVEEDGVYTSKEEVALYIHAFAKLPSNFITKEEAKKLGWKSNEGNLDKVAPGKSIGGDRFGNYEEQLPVEQGRKYYECDINYEGGYRNAERLIYSNDGLIYYTNDHYETFELLYGE